MADAYCPFCRWIFDTVEEFNSHHCTLDSHPITVAKCKYIDSQTNLLCQQPITKGLPFCAHHLATEYKIKIEKSHENNNNAGDGLFAIAAFEPGDLICPFYGLRKTDADEHEHPHYILDYRFTYNKKTYSYYDGFLPEGKGIGAMANTVIRRDPLTHTVNPRCISAKCNAKFKPLKIETTTFLNPKQQSRNATLTRFLVMINERNSSGYPTPAKSLDNYPWLVATKHIRPNSEILADYGPQYDCTFACS